jgi:hypothetical protein
MPLSKCPPKTPPKIKYMPAERLPNTSLDIALRRLELCTYAVQEIHIELDQPQDPESKADLILATEKLVSETVDLYQTVREYVWGHDPEDDVIESDL